MSMNARPVGVRKTAALRRTQVIDSPRLQSAEQPGSENIRFQNPAMSRDEGLAKLISIRHYCYQRGVIGRGGKRAGGEEDFRQSFRLLNRLYVELRDGLDLKGQRGAQKRVALQRRRAA